MIGTIIDWNANFYQKGSNVKAELKHGFMMLEEKETQD